MELAGYKPDMWFGKLDKKKSRVPDLHSNYNVGEPGASSKSGGAKAFFNVTSQISKLNPISKLKLSVRKSNQPTIPGKY